MPGFLRKLFGQRQAPQFTEEESDLEKFYTDAEHARQVFEQIVTAVSFPRRILVIHGLGGVGKSTLLKMYALTCRKHHIPAALVASEEIRSPVDVLAEWEADLNHDGITLLSFQKTLSHYRAIQAKVESEASKVSHAASQVAGTMGKTVAKTAINMAASAIPVVGPLVGAVGGESAEAFIDWLRGFLTKPDMDLYLDPAKRLDGDFLNDLSSTATRQRIVLMIDTYEQMTALDDWMRELARRLPKNVLLVIAGRTIPAWDRSWQDWMGKAEIVELKEMTSDDIRTLVHRYYVFIRSGEPDPKQEEAIVQFARGLPMVATTVVQLWVKYGLEDFQTVRPQVVADLVDRLLEGVPPEMRPAFESAAVLRYFNVEALSALLDNTNAEELYAELRRWPFIRSRKEGLAVHDTMREMINEALKVRTPERFRTLHERAAAYYEAQAAKRSGEKAEQLILERLYHLVQSGNEVTGIIESQVAIEMALGFYQRLFAESVITLLDQHLKEEQSRRWLAYLRWKVTMMNPQIEKIVVESKALVDMLSQPDLNPHLWALVAIDLAAAPSEVNVAPDKRLKWVEKAIGSAFLSPLEKAKGDMHLAGLYREKADWPKSIEKSMQAIQAYNQQENLFGKILAIGSLTYSYLLMGEWNNVIKWESERVALSRQMGGYSLIEALKILGWAYTYKGELALALSFIEEARTLAEQRQNEADLIRVTRRLAEVYDRENRWALSNSLYQDLIEKDKKYGRIVSMATLLALLGCSYLRQGFYENAEKLLLESLTHIEHYVEHIALSGLGELYLAQGRLNEARRYYERNLSVNRGRPYYVAQSMLGLLRVDIASLIFRGVAEKAQWILEVSVEQGYNDHLASLRLTQGHATWDGLLMESGELSSFDAALHFYQLTLIHALRFNRFLLDEALSGREQGTLLRPIIPHCLERGREGQRMLVALRDWWQSGINDIGTPRPDTISPIPEGISLLEAERIARDREPGDGSVQVSVVEQISKVLQ